MKRKQKDKLADNLPACAVEFIRLVIKKMRYRKKVRQDVQAELSAHFEDELKDLATDEEKAQKAQQLIAGFGDVKLLAVLLRRAKNRCRPLWRTAVVRTFQTVGMLIICIVIYVVWFLTGKPVVTTNYVAELNRIVRPVADENLNAAPFYHEAAKLVEKLSDDMKGLLRKKYDEVTAEEKQLIEKWLNGNKEILELVIAGTGKPYCWQKYEGEEMISILMPDLAEFRKLAYSLCWRAQLRAEQGRYEDAFGDIKSCYRFGQHIRGDKTLVEQLVGIAIEAMAIQTLRDILSEREINSVVLAALQRDLEQIISSEDFIVSFKAEKLFMYDEIQRWFTQDRFGGGHISLEALKRYQIVKEMSSVSLDFSLFEELWSKSLHILFTHPNKQQTREMADRCYAFLGKIAHKTPAQIRAEGIDIEKQAMEIIKGNILLEILTPAISRISELSHRNRADVEAVLTIIAILRYEQDSGGYPQNLQELIADAYLKQLPIDPYSNEPLVYRRTDEGFTLYSLGPNFTDDGGEYGKDRKGKPRLWYSLDADAVFWPVPKLQVKQ